VQSATAHFIYKVKSIKEGDILYDTKKSKVAGTTQSKMFKTYNLT